MYTQITTPAEADRIITADEPQWILKHSITCPVSAFAMQEFRRYLAAHPDEHAAVVIVQHARPVSNHIAERLGVRHESPQLFLVQAGRVLWDGSHGEVTAEAMAAARHQAAGRM